MSGENSGFVWEILKNVRLKFTSFKQVNKKGNIIFITLLLQLKQSDLHMIECQQMY